MIYMVFDVESVGLHGEGFAVGWVVVNGNTGKEIDDRYEGCDPLGADGSIEDQAWIAEHVAPWCPQTVDFPRDVRDLFWREWVIWRGKGAAYLVADVPWPVESRFLSACLDDEPGRARSAPYPIIDVASVRLAKWLDPLKTCPRKLEETPAHHPTCDARQSARLLLEALAR